LLRPRQDFIQHICTAISAAIGGSASPTLLHRPYFPPAAWKYVKECIDTGWVSSAGAFVTQFEQRLSCFTGCQHAIATVNGTAALQTCLFLAGVRRDDEVICPALTFVATANAISHCGALPHFIDVSASRLSIDPDVLEQHLQDIIAAGPDGPVNRHTGRRLGAVCVMHCFGHAAELDPIVETCRRYEIPLIEDAAESLGTYYRGRHTGRFGSLAAISFNGNKILTTGGGGAIITDDATLAERARHLTTTGKVAHPWEFHHDVVAWNHRMPNINAALGLAQLEVLPALLQAKASVAERYRAEFAAVKGATFLEAPPDSDSNHWLNNILLDRELEDCRDAILNELNAEGYQTRPIWKPMHWLPMYQHCPRGSMNVTESVYRRCISLPSSADLAVEWPAILAEALT
jgi:perosamine synthetase